MPKELGLEEVRVILESGNFNELIGAVENEQLECKAAPYQLDNDHHKQELAKDVSALANADGGIVLIGVRTEKDPRHLGDELVEIRPFEQHRVDLSQYFDVLHDWVYPALWQVEANWFPSAEELDKGIVAIAISNQPLVSRPFLVTRIIDPEGKMSEIVFGYCERQRDRVVPMSVEGLHARLKDGYNYEQLIKGRFDSIEETLDRIQGQITGPEPTLPAGPSRLDQLQAEHRPKVEDAIGELD